MKNSRKIRYSVLVFVIIIFVKINTININIHSGSNYLDDFNDPRLVISTISSNYFIFSELLGGSGDERISAVTIDNKGNVIVVGRTPSYDFPVLNAYDSVYGGGNLDAFVSKFSSDGNLIWSTFLGGNSKDQAEDVIVDNQDNIIVIGGTWSSDYPVSNVSQSVKGADAFVTKFASNGTLLMSTIIGGSSVDVASKIGLDSQNNIILSGTTHSDDFPVINASQAIKKGLEEMFISKLAPNGSIIWSTYLGGSDYDWGQNGMGLAIDIHDDIVVTGDTRSTDFPTLNAWDSSYSGNFDSFVTKFSSNGSLLWSTFLGGTNEDNGRGAVIDSQGDIIVTGFTKSPDFPIFNSSGTILTGSETIFITKFSSNGSLLWSSFFGGNSGNGVRNIIVDSHDNIIIMGATSSSDFPILNAYDSTFSIAESFISKFSSEGDLLWSTFLGGSSSDRGYDADIDTNHNLVIVGTTLSIDFPVTNPSQTISDRWRGFISYFYDPLKDMDDDGLPNFSEVALGLNITNPDTDSDLMPDGWEVNMSLNANNPNDAHQDKDNDGLTNLQEFQLGFNANNQDMDKDLMPDGWEYLMGLNVTNPQDASEDKDTDGLPNLWEYQNGLNATLNDAALDKDTDGLSNLQEYQLGLNANNRDTDYDQMPDGWEVQVTLNPQADDSTGDLDQDDLSNLQEYQIGTLANSNDTDSDQMPDGWEVQFSLNPLFDDANSDNDNDGLTNLEEYLLGSNPINGDTDSDGFNDGLEKLFGTNPLSSISNPLILILLIIIVISLGSAIGVSFYFFHTRGRIRQVLADEFSTSKAPVSLSKISSSVNVPKFIVKLGIASDQNLVMTPEGKIVNKKHLRSHITQIFVESLEPISLIDVSEEYSVTLSEVRSIVKKAMATSNLSGKVIENIFYPTDFFVQVSTFISNQGSGNLSILAEKFQINQKIIDIAVKNLLRSDESIFTIYLNPQQDIFNVIYISEWSNIVRRLSSAEGFTPGTFFPDLTVYNWRSIFQNQKLPILSYGGQLFTIEGLQAYAPDHLDEVTSIIQNLRRQLPQLSLASRAQREILQSFEQLLPIEPVHLPYYCQMGSAMIVKERAAYVCVECNRYTCPPCYQEMRETGMVNCINCGGDLVERPALQIEVDIERVDQMTGHEFENFLEGLFRTQMYRVEHIQSSGDHGVDLVVVKGETRTGVQAKRFKPSSKIGNQVLVTLKSDGYFHDCAKLMVVTTSYFTRKAQEYAQKVGIELWDRDVLRRYLTKYNEHLQDMGK